jgi:phosphate transport system protein
MLVLSYWTRQEDRGVHEGRKNYHQQLDEVRDLIVRLGGLVTETIAQGTSILLDGNLRGAEELIEADDVLDAMTDDIEERCIQLLVLQAPMASELRALVAALRMVAEIERSGDLMTNVAKATRRLYGVELPPKVRGLIERMGAQAQKLFRHAMDSYIDSDASLAAALEDMDDRMDDLHADYIQAIFETQTSTDLDLQAAVQLALVGRFYERIGDHAVNIGERVRFVVTGTLPEHGAAGRAGGSGEDEAVPDGNGERSTT